MSDAGTLAILKAALDDIVAGRVSSYTLPGGKTVTRHDPSELQALIEKYEARVAEGDGDFARIVEIG